MPNTVPDFGQIVEYVTEGPVIHPVALAQHDLESPLSLEAVRADYEHVAALCDLHGVPVEHVERAGLG